MWEDLEKGPGKGNDAIITSRSNLKEHSDCVNLHNLGIANTWLGFLNIDTSKTMRFCDPQYPLPPQLGSAQAQNAKQAC